MLDLNMYYKMQAIDAARRSRGIKTLYDNVAMPVEEEEPTSSWLDEEEELSWYEKLLQPDPKELEENIKRLKAGVEAATQQGLTPGSLTYRYGNKDDLTPERIGMGLASQDLVQEGNMIYRTRDFDGKRAPEVAPIAFMTDAGKIKPLSFWDVSDDKEFDKHTQMSRKKYQEQENMATQFGTGAAQGLSKLFTWIPELWSGEKENYSIRGLGKFDKDAGHLEGAKTAGEIAGGIASVFLPVGALRGAGIATSPWKLGAGISAVQEVPRAISDIANDEIGVTGGIARALGNTGLNTLAIASGMRSSGKIAEAFGAKAIPRALGELGKESGRQVGIAATQAGMDLGLDYAHSMPLLDATGQADVRSFTKEFIANAGLMAGINVAMEVVGFGAAGGHGQITSHLRWNIDKLRMPAEKRIIDFVDQQSPTLKTQADVEKAIKEAEKLKIAKDEFGMKALKKKLSLAIENPIRFPNKVYQMIAMGKSADEVMDILAKESIGVLPTESVALRTQIEEMVNHHDFIIKEMGDGTPQRIALELDENGNMIPVLKPLNEMDTRAKATHDVSSNALPKEVADDMRERFGSIKDPNEISNAEHQELASAMEVFYKKKEFKNFANFIKGFFPEKAAIDISDPTLSKAILQVYRQVTGDTPLGKNIYDITNTVVNYFEGAIIPDYFVNNPGRFIDQEVTKEMFPDWWLRKMAEADRRRIFNTMMMQIKDQRGLDEETILQAFKMVYEKAKGGKGAGGAKSLPYDMFQNWWVKKVTTDRLTYTQLAQKNALLYKLLEVDPAAAKARMEEMSTPLFEPYGLLPGKQIHLLGPGRTSPDGQPLLGEHIDFEGPGAPSPQAYRIDDPQGTPYDPNREYISGSDRLGAIDAYKNPPVEGPPQLTPHIDFEGPGIPKAEGNVLPFETEGTPIDPNKSYINEGKRQEAILNYVREQQKRTGQAATYGEVDGEPVMILYKDVENDIAFVDKANEPGIVIEEVPLQSVVAEESSVVKGIEPVAKAETEATVVPVAEAEPVKVGDANIKAMIDEASPEATLDGYLADGTKVEIVKRGRNGEVLAFDPENPKLIKYTDADFVKVEPHIDDVDMPADIPLAQDVELPKAKETIPDKEPAAQTVDAEPELSSRIPPAGEEGSGFDFPLTKKAVEDLKKPKTNPKILSEKPVIESKQVEASKLPNEETKLNLAAKKPEKTVLEEKQQSEISNPKAKLEVSSFKSKGDSTKEVAVIDGQTVIINENLLTHSGKPWELLQKQSSKTSKTRVEKVIETAATKAELIEKINAKLLAGESLEYSPKVKKTQAEIEQVNEIVKPPESKPVVKSVVETKAEPDALPIQEKVYDEIEDIDIPKIEAESMTLSKILEPKGVKETELKISNARRIDRYDILPEKDLENITSLRVVDGMMHPRMSEYDFKSWLKQSGYTKKGMEKDLAVIKKIRRIAVDEIASGNAKYDLKGREFIPKKNTTTPQTKRYEVALKILDSFMANKAEWKKKFPSISMVKQKHNNAIRIISSGSDDASAAVKAIGKELGIDEGTLKSIATNKNDIEIPSGIIMKNSYSSATVGAAAYILGSSMDDDGQDNWLKYSLMAGGAVLMGRKAVQYYGTKRANKFITAGVLPVTKLDNYFVRNYGPKFTSKTQQRYKSDLLKRESDPAVRRQLAERFDDYVRQDKDMIQGTWGVLRSLTHIPGKLIGKIKSHILEGKTQQHRVADEVKQKQDAFDKELVKFKGSSQRETKAKLVEVNNTLFTEATRIMNEPKVSLEKRLEMLDTINDEAYIKQKFADAGVPEAELDIALANYKRLRDVSDALTYHEVRAKLMNEHYVDLENADEAIAVLHKETEELKSLYQESVTRIREGKQRVRSSQSYKQLQSVRGKKASQIVRDRTNAKKLVTEDTDVLKNESNKRMLKSELALKANTLKAIDNAKSFIEHSSKIHHLYRWNLARKDAPYQASIYHIDGTGKRMHQNHALVDEAPFFKSEDERTIFMNQWLKEHNAQPMEIPSMPNVWKVEVQTDKGIEKIFVKVNDKINANEGSQYAISNRNQVRKMLIRIARNDADYNVDRAKLLGQIEQYRQQIEGDDAATLDIGETDTSSLLEEMATILQNNTDKIVSSKILKDVLRYALAPKARSLFRNKNVKGYYKDGMNWADIWDEGIAQATNRTQNIYKNTYTRDAVEAQLLEAKTLGVNNNYTAFLENLYDDITYTPASASKEKDVVSPQARRYFQVAESILTAGVMGLNPVSAVKNKTGGAFAVFGKMIELGMSPHHMFKGLKGERAAHKGIQDTDVYGKGNILNDIHKEVLKQGIVKQTAVAGLDEMSTVAGKMKDVRDKLYLLMQWTEVSNRYEAAMAFASAYTSKVPFELSGATSRTAYANDVARQAALFVGETQGIFDFEFRTPVEKMMLREVPLLGKSFLTLKSPSINAWALHANMLKRVLYSDQKSKKAMAAIGFIATSLAASFLGGVGFITGIQDVADVYDNFIKGDDESKYMFQAEESLRREMIKAGMDKSTVDLFSKSFHKGIISAMTDTDFAMTSSASEFAIPFIAQVAYQTLWKDLGKINEEGWKGIVGMLERRFILPGRISKAGKQLAAGEFLDSKGNPLGRKFEADDFVRNATFGDRVTDKLARERGMFSEQTTTTPQGKRKFIETLMTDNVDIGLKPQVGTPIKEKVSTDPRLIERAEKIEIELNKVRDSGVYKRSREIAKNRIDKFMSAQGEKILKKKSLQGGEYEGTNDMAKRLIDRMNNAVDDYMDIETKIPILQKYYKLSSGRTLKIQSSYNTNKNVTLKGVIPGGKHISKYPASERAYWYAIYKFYDMIND